jgi:vacuolar protein sorting-associated protein 13A/C
LGSKPTVLRLSEVFVIAAPEAVGVKRDEETERQRELENKRRRLRIADESSLHPQVAADKPPSANDETFLQRTVTTVVANLQVFVDTIHIRFEDTINSPTPFAIGVTIGNP